MDILISEEFDSPAIQKLEAKYKVVRDGGLWKNPAKLKEMIAGARAVIVRNQTQLTSEVLSGAPKLIGIGRMGVGLDNIDMPTATKLGIVVISPLDANSTSVAELCLAFMLGLARKIPAADRSTRGGAWDRKSFVGVELDGKTLGICGFGRIGRKVSLLARAFGMKSVVYDPYVKADSPALLETGAKLMGTVEEVLSAADFVTTHLPQTPQTKRMFNERTFSLMKRGAFFINTARGGVVDECALVAALKSGHLGGAALDVREVEPPTEKTGLEQLDNVILAPHIGAFTAESQARTVAAVSADVDRLLSGEAVVNFVNMSKPARVTAET